MTLTISGLAGDLNEERARKAIMKSRGLETAGTTRGLRTDGPRNRLKLLLKTYMRSTYMYNAILHPSMTALQKVYNEFINTLLTIMLNCKEKGLTKKVLHKTIAIMCIKPLTWRILSEASGFLAKME